MSDMKKKIFFCLLIPLFCVGVLPQLWSSENAVAVQEVIPVRKPKNFHQVNKLIYRSGQPETDEFVSVSKEYGIRSVLNLRQWHSDSWKIAAANRQLSAGLRLYEIPLNTSRITERDLYKILTVIRDGPKPVLIHCWHGSDRTGCAVAASRIVVENWSVEDAVNELMKEEYGHHKTIYTNIPELLRKADWQKIKAVIVKK
jgi:protein tyrosine/serine phosphatase